MSGMRYDLRTLLIAVAVGPAIIAGLYWFGLHVMAMEEWKFVLASIGLIASFYFLRDMFMSEDGSLSDSQSSPCPPEKPLAPAKGED